jgi:hypothetical protein
MIQRLYIFLFLFVALYSTAQAQDKTGTISGIVKDALKGSPIEGVLVSVRGTAKSTVTNKLGYYELTNIKKGEYIVEVSLLGYEKLIFTEIKVTVGGNTSLPVTLEQSSITLEQSAKIIGKKPLVDVNNPKTTNTIGSDQIELAPVRQVQKIINTQPGVMNSPTGINIRGGRSYETNFMIDGVSATDPLGGTGFGLDLGSNSMSDIEIITGGIGAEIGDATAGVVSAKTKSGGNKTEFFVQYKRDNFGNYKNWNSVFNQEALEASLGGPFLKKKLKNKLKYFTTVRMNLTDDFTRNPANQVISSLFPNTFWTPKEDSRWAAMIKLNYDINPKMKLAFTYLRSLTVNQDVNMLRITGNNATFAPGYQYLFSQQMDKANTFTHDSYLGILNFTHTTSKKFFYTATLSRLFVRLRADANGLPWRPSSVDGQFDPDNIITYPTSYFNNNDSINFVNPANGFYNNGGVATLWHQHYVEEKVLRWNGTYFQKKSGNKLNFGLEMKAQDLLWIDINRPWIGAPIQLANGTSTQSFRLGDASDIWNTHVRRGAVFFTDKIKYKGLVADLGLRFEYWAPGRFVDEAIANPAAPIRQEVREEYIKNTVKIGGLRYKLRALPRISASFPIRENQMLYFNYGHTTILPHPSYIYAGLNPAYTDRSTAAKVGNPNINPEVDISYEIGLRSQITSNDALSIAAYVKDKYEFITQASILINDVNGRAVSRSMAINADYARMRGFEVTYIKRIKTWFVGQLSLAYMNATGQSASASEALKEVLASGAREDTKEFYLPWDRPFDIKFNTTFKQDNKKGLWKGRLNHFALYFETTLRSGTRYTPYVFTGYEPATNRPIWVTDPNPESKFSKIGTPWLMSDLNFRKWWVIKRKYLLAMTIEVTNLFNSRNASIINPVTGTAYQGGQDVPTEWQDPRFIDPRDPRSSSVPPTNPSRYLEQRHYLVGMSLKF